MAKVLLKVDSPDNDGENNTEMVEPLLQVGGFIAVEYPWWNLGKTWREPAIKIFAGHMHDDYYIACCEASWIDEWEVACYWCGEHAPKEMVAFLTLARRDND